MEGVSAAAASHECALHLQDMEPLYCKGEMGGGRGEGEMMMIGGGGSREARKRGNVGRSSTL